MASVPDQFDETVARALGTAFVEMLRESGDDADQIVIAHDMRESGPGLAAAFARGANAAGAAVVNIGLASTDGLYYASGALGLPGAMFTASHNPAQVQRHQAVPGRRRAGRAGQRPGRRPPPRRGAARRPERRGRRPVPGRAARPARRLRRAPALAGRPLRHPPAQGHRRRRQRDGRLHRPGRARRPGAAGAAADDRPALLRAGRLVPQPRGQPARPGQPGRPAERHPRAGRRHRRRLRRRRRPVLRHRRDTATRSRPRRSPRWSPYGSWPSSRAARSSTT